MPIPAQPGTATPAAGLARTWEAAYPGTADQLGRVRGSVPHHLVPGRLPAGITRLNEERNDAAAGPRPGRRRPGP